MFVVDDVATRNGDRSCVLAETLVNSLARYCTVSQRAATSSSMSTSTLTIKAAPFDRAG